MLKSKKFSLGVILCTLMALCLSVGVMFATPATAFADNSVTISMPSTPGFFDPGSTIAKSDPIVITNSGTIPLSTSGGAFSLGSGKQITISTTSDAYFLKRIEFTGSGVKFKEIEGSTFWEAQEQEEVLSQTFTARGSFTLSSVTVTYKSKTFSITNECAEENKEDNGGYIEVNPLVAAGEEVRVEAFPNEGYELFRLFYYENRSGDWTYFEDKMCFDMPGKNIHVDALFTAKTYTITNDTPSSSQAQNNGYIEIKEEAETDEEVTVEVTANEGYQLKSLKYNDGTTDYDITADKDGKYIFTMPAKAVTVTAEFETAGDKMLDCTVCAGRGWIIDPGCFYCQGNGICSFCDGKGICEECEGTGNCLMCEGSGVCSDCGGDGCDSCEGSGYCSACGGTMRCWSCNGIKYCYQCHGSGDCHFCTFCTNCGGTGKVEAPNIKLGVIVFSYGSTKVISNADIKFTTEGGEVYTTKSNDYGMADLVIPQNAKGIFTVTADGYQDYVSESVTFGETAEDKHFYLVSTATSHTVSFSAATGGSVDCETISNVENGTAYSFNKNVVTIGSKNITATPESGYKFATWKLNSVSTTSNGTITDDFDFEAIFEKDASATWTDMPSGIKVAYGWDCDFDEEGIKSTAEEFLGFLTDQSLIESTMMPAVRATTLGEYYTVITGASQKLEGNIIPFSSPLNPDRNFYLVYAFTDETVQPGSAVTIYILTRPQGATDSSELVISETYYSGKLYGGEEQTAVAEIDCPTCHGDGLAQCSECFGRGCDACDGGNVPCPDCNKTGKLSFATLEDAITAVTYYGKITLLKDNSEEIEISKEIVFTVDKTTFTFDKSKITAGTGYDVSTREIGTATTFIVTLQKTVADILPSYFPTSFETGWTDKTVNAAYNLGEGTYKVFVSNGYLILSKNGSENICSIAIDTDIEKVWEDFYTAKDSNENLYNFDLTNGIISNISITDSNSHNYGAYYIGLTDVISKSKETFPTDVENGWLGDNGLVLYADRNDSLMAQASKGKKRMLKAPIGEANILVNYIIQTNDGNYLFVDEMGGNVLFTITDNYLTSITISNYMGPSAVANGTYTAPTPAITVESIFNTVDNVWSWTSDKGESLGDVLSSDIYSEIVTTADNLTYTLSYNGMNISLVTDGTTLQSITIAGASFAKYDGTYTAPAPAHDLIVTKIDGGTPVEGTKDSHDGADYYWDEDTLYILKSGLSVSSTATEERIQVTENATDLTLAGVNLTGDLPLTLEGEEVELILVEGTTNILFAESDYGAFLGANVTIKGKGTLDISTADTDNDDGTWGLTCTTTLTIEDATVIIATGESEIAANYGIYVGKGFTLNSGSVDITANSSGSNKSYGIYIDDEKGAITVNGGTIIARAYTQAMTVAPTGKVVQASVNRGGDSPVATYKAEDIATYKYLKVEKPAPTYTIADIIATNPDFPTTYENGWDAGTDYKLYSNATKLVMKTSSAGSVTFPSSNEVSQSGDSYVYISSGNYKMTFTMEKGVLSGVTFEHINYSFVAFDGKYTAPHVHNFTYSANSNVLTATCDNLDSKCTLPECKLTLTLTAPTSLTFDNNPKAFTFADGEATAWTNAGLELPTIFYNIKQSGQSSYSPLMGTLKFVGDYMAQITVDGKTASVQFNISQAEVDKPQEDTTVFTYNGNPQTYNIAPNELYSIDGNEKTDADNYIVIVSLKDKTNYKWKSADSEDLIFFFVIAKATGAISVDTTTITKAYGEAVILPTATSNFGTVSCDTLATDLVNVNSYTVTYTLDGTDNYTGDTKTLTVVINKAEVTKPNADTTNFIYTGSPLTYNVTENDLYTISGNVETDAGDNYTVTVSLKDKVNYKWKDGDSEDLTFDFVIAKATGAITVDTTTITKTYGEAVILPTATSNFGTVSCDTLATDLVNANTYTVTYTLDGTDNYTGDVKTLTVVINKAEVTKPNADTTNFVYTGSPLTYTVASNTLYTVSGNVETDAGTYEVKIELNNKTNYKWANGDSEDLTFDFVIAKATGAITVDTTTITKTYGEAVTLPIATSNFGTVSCDTLATDLVNANTYTVTYTLDGTNNYTGDSKELTVVINRATVTKPNEDTTNFVDNGEAQTYTIEASDYYTVENNVQTNAGKYTVTVSLNDKENTAWADGTTDDLTFDFVINQKAEEVQVKDETGKEITDSKVMIVSGENGIEPGAVFVVEVINLEKTEDTEQTETLLVNGEKIAKNEKIYGIYDAKLLLDGASVQPNGTITIKMFVPEELREKEFRLYHIHNGTEVIEIDNYTDAGDGYITFEVDKLSQFAFVAEKDQVCFIHWILIALLLIGAGLFVFFYFFMKKDLFALITCGVGLIASIVLLILGFCTVCTVFGIIDIVAFVGGLGYTAYKKYFNKK